jgi:hypothetical protein
LEWRLPKLSQDKLSQEMPDAIKAAMRKILLTLVVALLPTLAASAEQPARQQPRKPTAPLGPVKSNPCAAYGAGFVQVAGSSTCVKMGGSVTVDVGGRTAR